MVFLNFFVVGYQLLVLLLHFLVFGLHLVVVGQHLGVGHAASGVLAL